MNRNTFNAFVVEVMTDLSNAGFTIDDGEASPELRACESTSDLWAWYAALIQQHAEFFPDTIMPDGSMTQLAPHTTPKETPAP